METKLFDLDFQLLADSILMIIATAFLLVILVIIVFLPIFLFKMIKKHKSSNK
ncbi:MAG: hypothetical protein PUD93_07450 [Lachnospiraceae bacterium]|nr:hypothetical protein [Lachnospiraceae bacterium]